MPAAGDDLLGKKLLADLRLAYDRSAERRSQNPRGHWREQIRKDFLALIRKEAKVSILEIGAGPGLDSLFFMQEGLEVICTDLSSENVRLARKSGLDARVMDFSDLQFPPSSFDAVYAMSCLLHVPSEHLASVLEGIRSVLVPNGLFFYGQWGGERIEGIFEDDDNVPKRFFCLYPDDVLLAIVKAHFQVISFETIEVEGQKLHYQSFFLRVPVENETQNL